MYPDTELISFLQTDHLSLRGRAHARDLRRPAVAVQVAEGLRHSLLLCFHIFLQLYPAGQGALRVSLGEGHPGVDVVVTRLVDSQPDIVVVVDAPEG